MEFNGKTNELEIRLHQILQVLSKKTIDPSSNRKHSWCNASPSVRHLCFRPLAWTICCGFPDMMLVIVRADNTPNERNKMPDLEMADESFMMSMGSFFVMRMPGESTTILVDEFSRVWLWWRNSAGSRPCRRPRCWIRNDQATAGLAVHTKRESLARHFTRCSSCEIGWKMLLPFQMAYSDNVRRGTTATEMDWWMHRTCSMSSLFCWFLAMLLVLWQRLLLRLQLVILLKHENPNYSSVTSIPQARFSHILTNLYTRKEFIPT